jgi:hypothetical protein
VRRDQRCVCLARLAPTTLKVPVAQTTEHQTNGQKSREPFAAKHFRISTHVRIMGSARMSKVLKFHAHKRCGAYARKTGKPCQAPGIGRGGRCKMHGGLSTGAKSKAGKIRRPQPQGVGCLPGGSGGGPTIAASAASELCGVCSHSGQLVEKEINGGNPAVSGNDEVSPGVSWRLTRTARYPLDPPTIAQFLGPGDGLISKVR